MVTLEARLATLKAQELYGADLLKPFPAVYDGEPCQVTWVGERTAVICDPAVDPGIAEKRLANLKLITVDPADVKLSNSKRASLTARERAAATRGRNKGLHSPLRKPGIGVRQAAERARTAQDATEAVG